MADSAVKIPFIEAAAPSTPAASRVVIYCKADGLMYSKDDAGVETLMSAGISGSVATDPIWDAAGDLVQGTGANTAAKLSAGTAGQFLKSGGAATANAWASRQLDLVTFTGNTNVVATAAASATTIVTANAVSFDGSTQVFIEFYAPDCSWTGGNAGDLGIFYLYDGSSEIGFGGLLANTTATNTVRQTVHLSIPITPSNASHTYSIRGTVTNAARPLAVTGGAGGSGVRTNGYIRITRAV